MGSRRLLVFVLLALSGLGWAAAHALAHRLVKRGDAHGESALEGYLGYLPTSLALCLALALLVAAAAALGVRWRPASARSFWLFGAVPVLGFAGHALAEPLLSGPPMAGAAPAGSAGLAAVGLIGLLVQLPFALVAVALASGIFRLAAGVARVLAGPASTASHREAERHEPASAARIPAFRLDRAHGQRAPPSLLPA